MQMGNTSTPEVGMLLKVGSHTITVLLLLTPLQGFEQHSSLADA